MLSRDAETGLYISSKISYLDSVSYVMHSKGFIYFYVVLNIRAGQETILLIFSQLYNFLFAASSVFC